MRNNKDYQKFKDSMDKAMLKIGFEYLCKGVDRRVYVSACGNYVAKIDTSIIRNLSSPQNDIEIKVYACLPKQLQQYFLKPIAYDKKRFKWILTHKAETYNNGDLTYEETHDIIKGFREIFEKHGLHIEDLHTANVGKFEGEPVVIDYGFGVYNTEGKRAY